MKKVLLIIPAYNEEECILNTYNKVLKYDYDVIVINDGSTDNTKVICEENNIPVINLINNLGIGGAMQTGYKYAYQKGYDIAVQFDADGQHNVEYVDNLIQPIINEEIDAVIGSRFIKVDKENFLSTKSRRVGIKIISLAIKLRTKYKIYDTTSGFRAVNKKVIELFAKNYPSEYPEPITNMILIKEKYKVKEISVRMNERESGVSSIRKLKSIYYMINVLFSILLVEYKGGSINE